MSDQPTEMLPTQRDSMINRIQRFFEDWWPAVILILIIAATITIAAVVSDDPDMTYCTARHGHVVRTGVGHQVACVDDTWRLETP